MGCRPSKKEKLMEHSALGFLIEGVVPAVVTGEPTVSALREAVTS